MRLRSRIAPVLMTGGAVLCAALPACSFDSKKGGDANALALSADPGLVISSPLTLSTATISPGSTLNASVTYTNRSGAPIALGSVVIAGRPPGGTHAGGPYDDLAPAAGAVTLGDGQSVTVNASRAFAADDPTGTWILYPTYQDDSGNWHDGPELQLDVSPGCVQPPPPPSPPAANGSFSTRGNQIIDSNGDPFRIASVGWDEIGAGPYQDFDQNVSAIKAAGFNTIRTSWVNATMSDGIAVIDKIVASASKYGVKVILNNHTNEPGHGPQDNWGAQQKNGLWYDLGGASDNTDGGGNPGTVTDAKFLSDWVAVAKHYAGNTTVIGFDIRNEPLAYPGMCTWGDGDVNHDLRAMYERVGNAILAVDPGKLIIAEGPQDYSGNFAGSGQAPWGDLSLAGQYPVRLNVPDKLVYSIHDYPLEVAGFKPDNGPDKVALMNKAWGYLVVQNVAPVWIGEMGSSMQGSTDTAWAQTLVDYTNGKLGALGGPTFGAGQKGIGTDWWAWGYLPGQYPDGTQNPDGSLRSDQQAVYSQLQ